MKEHVKEAIFAYFRSLGQVGGKTVQPGNMLARSVKVNLPNELRGWYDEAVKDLYNEGFLRAKNAVPASEGSLGNVDGYVITEAGVNRL